VNVTDDPVQIVVELALMLMLATVLGVMVIVMLLEVAGELTKHGVAFDVITQVTASELAKVVVLYVLLLLPTLVPFTFHW
jgi:hypothetical protein